MCYLGSSRASDTYRLCFSLQYATLGMRKDTSPCLDVQVLINNSSFCHNCKSKVLLSLFILACPKENRYQRRGLQCTSALCTCKGLPEAHWLVRQIKIKTPRIDSQKLRVCHDRQRRQDCDKARSGRHIHKDTIKMEMDQRGLAIARNRIDKNQPKSLKNEV
jgi:hypothetical protein